MEMESGETQKEELKKHSNKTLEGKQEIYEDTKDSNK
jgi:hypothetical protein